ncbi:MAG: hypothetical protein SOW59_02190 [Corynebacterium sp.]|nr:hypothetical protein [Corynebacterium sp.]
MTDHFRFTAEQAQLLADALTNVPGVVRLHPGTYGEVSLLFPGLRVPGLRHLSVRDDTGIAAYVVLDLNADIPAADVAAAVRAKARETLPALRHVDVIIADAE